MLTLLHCSNFLTLNSLVSFYAIFGLLLSWSQYLKKPHSTPNFKFKVHWPPSPPAPLTITFHVFHWLLGSLLLRNIKNCLDKSSQIVHTFFGAAAMALVIVFLGLVVAVLYYRNCRRWLFFLKQSFIIYVI